MEKLSYFEEKESTIECYNEFVEIEKFNQVQAIAATLEDSSLVMRANEKAYLAVIVTLSIISLKNNFIDDYLLERIDIIKLKQNVELSGEEKSVFEKDMNIIDELLESDYKVIKNDNFKRRVTILLLDK
jgi:hypothetical protein